MRSSLIVLAIVVATLRLLQAALARRAQGVSVVTTSRRRRPSGSGVSALSLPEGGAGWRGTAEAGRKGANDAARGDRRTKRFAEWRYYGFSGRSATTEPSDLVPPDVVASPPAVGSIVTTLPDGCVTTVVNGRVYRHCGSVWYQRQDTGSKVTYVVVPAP